MSGGGTMASSYNGWPASDDRDAIGVVPSYWFPGGVKAGDVQAVLGYVAAQLDARVEPIVDGHCWGYTYKANVNNPSQLSCHASGTAIDFNAPAHPNGSSNTFTDQQVGEIYAILDEVQGSVSWLSGYDEMHFEICCNATDLAQVAATLPSGGGVGPDDGEDDMTKDECQAAMEAALAPLLEVTRGVLEHTGETRRMVGVLAGWPGGADVEASVGVQTVGALSSSGQLEHLAELRRMVGVVIGYPPAGPPEQSLADQLG